MNVRIGWTADQVQEVLVALDRGVGPSLDPGIATSIRRAAEQSAPVGDVESYWIELTLQQGQLLKRWCDAERERATEREPDALWTRIVAKVNEAVQLAAPAKLDRQEP